MADETTRGLTRRWRRRGAPAAGGDLVSRVLAARGLTGEAEVGRFLNPSLTGLHDPGLMPGLERAAERVLAAARAGEPIAVYGDYDVDGVTATAILVRTLRALAPGAPVTTYIPHRLDEGYGLNEAAVRSLAASGHRVIVSVDCGITAFGPARAAREAGVDLIITDHHNPPAEGEPVPEAFALVHPRAPGSGYPFGELCGAGVAYKLAWRLATMAAGGDRVGAGLRTVLLELLALAALGTIADVVPLVDENRVIARHGLRCCRSSGIVGLGALVSACRLDGESIDAERVGFMLAPRLNACGRLGHAAEALELLLTDDQRRAAEIAARLSTVNDERRATERAIVDQAAEMAEAEGMTGPERRAIVLAREGWHPGVLGIACSRLVERYGRPAVLLSRPDGGGVCVGSGRSVDGFNLHAALAACQDRLVSFGGHDMAAGLKLDAGELDAFASRFIDEANAALDPDDLVPALGYDAEASLAELSTAAVQGLAGLAPFGRGNPPVRLRVNGLRLAGEPRPFGKRGDHASFRLESVGPDGRRSAVRAVGWKFMEHASGLASGETVDAVLVPKLSAWRGFVSVEPELVDLAQTIASTTANRESALAGGASGFGSR